MYSRRLISILSLLLLALSVFGKSNTQHLRRSVSIDLEHDRIESEIIENDEKKRLLVSNQVNNEIILDRLNSV